MQPADEAGADLEVRLAALAPAQLDHRDGEAWSPRHIAFHLEGSLYYAEAVGHL